MATVTTAANGDVISVVWPVKAEHLAAVLRRHPEVPHYLLPALRRFPCYMEMIDGYVYAAVICDRATAGEFRSHPWSMQVRDDVEANRVHVDFQLPDEMADELLVLAANEEGTW
jgi:hypothetical protein